MISFGSSESLLVGGAGDAVSLKTVGARGRIKARAAGQRLPREVKRTVHVNIPNCNWTHAKQATQLVKFD